VQLREQVEVVEEKTDQAQKALVVLVVVGHQLTQQALAGVKT
jgi:hypothetical protein